MSIKLQNRKAAEAKLGSFVECLSLPPALVQAIVQGEVDEGFRVRPQQSHSMLPDIIRPGRTAGFESGALRMEAVARPLHVAVLKAAAASRVKARHLLYRHLSLVITAFDA